MMVYALVVYNTLVFYMKLSGRGLDETACCRRALKKVVK